MKLGSTAVVRVWFISSNVSFSRLSFFLFKKLSLATSIWCLYWFSIAAVITNYHSLRGLKKLSHNSVCQKSRKAAKMKVLANEDIYLEALGKNVF